MSNFLGFESYLIALGAAIEDMKATFRATLTSRGYQIVYESAPVASTFGTFGTPANAFNVDPYSSATIQASSLPATLGVQAPSAFTPSTLILQGSPTPYESPRNFTLDYSDNGTAWTTLQSWTNELNWGIGEQRVYAIVGAAAHTYWRITVSSCNAPGSEYATVSSIVLQDANNRRLTTNTWMAIAPPANEPIGNAVARDLLYMEFAGTYMRFIPVQERLVFQPQVVGIWPKAATAGAVAPSVFLSAYGSPFSFNASISGSTMTVTASTGTLKIGAPIYGQGVPDGTYIQAIVSGSGGSGAYTLSKSLTVATTTLYANDGVAITAPVGAAGNTASQNLRALYETLAASTDANVTAYSWEYSYAPPQNANDTNEYIYGTAKTDGICGVIAPNPVSANVNAAVLGNRQQPLLMQPYINLNSTNGDMTVDLVSGWVYYLQVCSRGIAIASKTNSNFFGPFHACWSEHTRALNAMPVNAPLVTPIELLVGTDGNNTNLTSTANSGHAWALPSTTSLKVMFSSSYPSLAFNGAYLRDKFIDVRNGINSEILTSRLVGSGIANDDVSCDDFQIHRSNCVQLAQGSSYCNGFCNLKVVPILDIQDWYKFRGSATNESLLLVADTVAITTIAQDLDGTSDYPVIALTSTSGFQSSGFVVIENEVIQYTGITGNSLTGCTRAKYGTTKAKHFNSVTQVAQGLWFVVINGGALFAGYNKPS